MPSVLRSTAARRTLAALVAPALLSATICLGQTTYTARVRGVVTDEHGDVVSGAVITITDDTTSVSKSATTDGAGAYTFDGLRPSTYSLNAVATGFQEVIQKNVVLAVSQQTTLDFTLRPAGLAAEVTVVDTAPLLDTGS